MLLISFLIFSCSQNILYSIQPFWIHWNLFYGQCVVYGIECFLCIWNSTHFVTLGRSSLKTLNTSKYLLVLCIFSEVFTFYPCFPLIFEKMSENLCEIVYFFPLLLSSFLHIFYIYIIKKFCSNIAVFLICHF